MKIARTSFSIVDEYHLLDGDVRAKLRVLGLHKGKFLITCICGFADYADLKKNAGWSDVKIMMAFRSRCYHHGVRGQRRLVVKIRWFLIVLTCLLRSPIVFSSPTIPLCSTERRTTFGWQDWWEGGISAQSCCVQVCHCHIHFPTGSTFSTHASAYECSACYCNILYPPPHSIVFSYSDIMPAPSPHSYASCRSDVADI